MSVGLYNDINFPYNFRVLKRVQLEQPDAITIQKQLAAEYVYYTFVNLSMSLGSREQLRLFS